MSISAANSAGPPYVSLCPCRWTNQSSISRYVSNHYHLYPVLCSVTASGLFRRPAALGLLLRIARPFGVPVLPKTSLQSTAKDALQTSFGSLRESRPSALGSRATR